LKFAYLLKRHGKVVGFGYWFQLVSAVLFAAVVVAWVIMNVGSAKEQAPFRVSIL
jgi:hypothetical protein